MEFLVKALLVGLIAWGVGWTIVEFIAAREGNSGPSGPSSGVETAIGKQAVVTGAFSRGENGETRGRVRFEGEDWKAVFVGHSATPPAKGEQVTVVDVDAGHLEVRVK